MDTPLRPLWMRELNGWLDQARAALGPEASTKAWAEGLALGVVDAVAEAMAANRTSGESVGAGSASVSVGTAEGQPSLTRRETEVLQMVAGGNTNKEIASHLLLSVATVERHIANIYGKIGARGRAEATAFAITRGLVAPARD
jgi:DNA-binding NarL/FixJ family response regulator